MASGWSQGWDLSRVRSSPPTAPAFTILGPNNEIFDVSTLGGASRKLVDSAGPFTVSSRGEIAFARIATGGGASPMMLVTPGAPAAAWHPECSTVVPPGWSPDGQELAFAGQCNNEAGLFLAPRSGGARRRVPRDDLWPSRSGESLVMWSRLAWFRLASGRDGSHRDMAPRRCSQPLPPLVGRHAAGCHAGHRLGRLARRLRGGASRLHAGGKYSNHLQPASSGYSERRPRARTLRQQRYSLPRAMERGWFLRACSE